ncbi:hypothetical protein U9M48_025603 [Paspalum notatum var. saurae]|uniref:NADP-dependent oxidoreductase domain-containing protein n=1 Tax=Paspalum notatum var. saurae TaxID=547442 RepID=A0AAQ3TR26_PASNO
MAMPTFNLAPDLPPVSRLCFGTMTMGEQSGAACSLRLLDAAFDAGVNFFDSAEMYPVPQRSDTRGRSEEILGRWLRARGVPRDQVVVATKVAGPSGQMTWIRGGPRALDSENIAEAIDGRCLITRLGFCADWARITSTSTRYIGLIGLHLSSCDLTLVRVLCTLIINQAYSSCSYVPMFGETEYDPSCQFASVPMEEQLEALGKAIDAGKIKYIGLSNETPYGLMKFLQLSKDFQLRSKLLTLQNSYNLLCRNFDSGLAECCHHERISLLAYSPMAMGILSGKYHSSDDCGPPDARMNLFRGRYSEGESRYKLQSPKVKAAVKEYTEIAGKYGISPATLAIAFVLRHPLVASAVFGATKLWQLYEILQATRVRLPKEILVEINDVHARYPNPCP